MRRRRTEVNARPLLWHRKRVYIYIRIRYIAFYRLREGLLADDTRVYIYIYASVVGRYIGFLRRPRVVLDFDDGGWTKTRIIDWLRLVPFFSRDSARWYW